MAVLRATDAATWKEEGGTEGLSGDCGIVAPSCDIEQGVWRESVGRMRRSLAPMQHMRRGALETPTVVESGLCS